LVGEFVENGPAFDYLTDTSESKLWCFRAMNLARTFPEKSSVLYNPYSYVGCTIITDERVRSVEEEFRDIIQELNFSY
jgi:hypothetical protein